MYIDSHCHLDRLDLKAYDGELVPAIDAAKDNGVAEMLCVAIDRDNISDVVNIARRFDNVWASVGIHPSSVTETVMGVDELCRLADDPCVIAIGETGLDYYYSDELAEFQKQSFTNHLLASSQTNKPVIVHTRSAKEDTLAIIRASGDSEVAGVLHCFTEDWDMAKQALDLNYYISFSGIVTFKNAEELRDVAKRVPADRFLIETDSPYLAPVPYRGKSNEPKYVPEVAKCLGEVRGVSVETIAEQSSENFKRLFSHAR